MRRKCFRSSWLACLLSVWLAVPQSALVTAQAQPAAPAKPAAQTPSSTPATKPPAPAKAPAKAVATTPPPGTNADTGWPRTSPSRAYCDRSAPDRELENKEHPRLVGWPLHADRGEGPALGTIRSRPTKVADDRREHGPEDHGYNFLALERPGQKLVDGGRSPQNESVDLDRVLAAVSQSALQVKGAATSRPPAEGLLVNHARDPRQHRWRNDLESRALISDTRSARAGISNTRPARRYLRDNQSWLQAAAVGAWSPVKGKLPESFSSCRLTTTGRMSGGLALQSSRQAPDGLREHGAGRVDPAPRRGQLLEGGITPRCSGSTTRKATCSGWDSLATTTSWSPDAGSRRLPSPARGRLPRRRFRRTSRRSPLSMIGRVCWPRCPARGRRPKRCCWPRFPEPRASTRRMSRHLR